MDTNTKPEFVYANTGLYSAKAKEIMCSVFGQLSDGWGENNPRNDVYWKFGEVVQRADGEIAICIKTKCGERSYSGHWTYNKLFDIYLSEGEQSIKNWMAKLIKKTMRMELRDGKIPNGWKRDNVATKTCYLNYHEDISVQEVYIVYEHLLGRNYEKHYEPAAVLAIVGCPLSEKDIAINKAKAAAKAEAEAKIALLREETKKKIEEITKAMNLELTNKINEIMATVA